jgi:hypothetical protein
MFCIVAFVVLSILGIFSATQRSLAKEAMDCVFRRITLRPCNTGFDEKMKASILGSVIMRSEKTAGFLNKNFELLSWIFFILMLGSNIWFVRGVYLFYTSGSCNGLNSSAFCVFDPTGANNQASVGTSCGLKPASETTLTLDGVDLTGQPVMNPTSTDRIILIGCYHCDYTRKTYPMIRQLVDHFQANFTYVNFPTKEKTDYFTRLAYCVNQQAPDKFWAFNDRMYTGEKEQLEDDAYMRKMLSDVGVKPDLVRLCVDDARTVTAVQTLITQITDTGFFGTPTVFIHDKAYVGPKPYRVYAISLKGLFYFLR